MESNDVRQSDLPEVGSQGVVSEILKGKRDLNTRQITELSRRFKVSLAAYDAEAPRITTRQRPDSAPTEPLGR
jgi:HTH-type transcriptional regulator/antitoxin HigA